MAFYHQHVLNVITETIVNETPYKGTRFQSTGSWVLSDEIRALPCGIKARYWQVEIQIGPVVYKALRPEDKVKVPFCIARYHVTSNGGFYR